MVYVTAGTQCMCTFGTAPSVLNVTSQSKLLMGNKPVATIADCAPNTNLPPFALCTSLQNPAVQAATAAALGVLTPQPCTLVPAGTWRQSQTTTQTGGKPCLVMGCTLTCGLGGGTISVTSPAQQKVIHG